MKKTTRRIAAVLATMALAAGASSCSLFGSDSGSGNVARAEEATNKQVVYYDDESGGVSPSKPAQAEADEDLCTVNINVKYKHNWIKAKYNIDVFIDGAKADSLGNNTTKPYTFTGKKGKYIVRAEKNGDSSVFGEATFNVFEDGQTIQVNIKTHDDYIEVAVKD